MISNSVKQELCFTRFADKTSPEAITNSHWVLSIGKKVSNNVKNWSPETNKRKVSWKKNTKMECKYKIRSY